MLKSNTLTGAKGKGNYNEYTLNTVKINELKKNKMGYIQKKFGIVTPVMKI